MRNLIHHDVTPDELLEDRDKLEQLISAYKTLKHTLEYSPLPFALYDEEGTIQMWNEAYVSTHKKMFDEHRDKIEAGEFSFEELIKSAIPSGLGVSEGEAYLAECKKDFQSKETTFSEHQFDDNGWYKIMRYRLPNGLAVAFATDINKEKSQQEEIEKAKSESDSIRNYFEEAISVLDDGFVIFDKDDRLLYWNEAMLEQFGDGTRFFEKGKTYEQICGDLIDNNIIPCPNGDKEEFISFLLEKRKSEEGFSNTFQRHDGEWIRQRDKRTASGQLVGLRTNITELKENEFEIENKSRLLLETTEAMTQGIMVFHENKIEFYNQRMSQILQVPDELLKIGGNWEELITFQRARGIYGADDEAQALIDGMLDSMKNRETFEHERNTPDGRTLLTVCVFNNDDRCVVTISDITDIRHRDRELEKKSKLLQDTTDAMIQGIVVFGEENIEFVNPEALRMLQVPGDILAVGKPWREYLRYNLGIGLYGDDEGAIERCNKLIYEIENGISHSTERQLPNGRTMQIDGASNGASGWIVSYTDITEIKIREHHLKEAIKEAEAAERAKSEFLANMSHEIRTPMNGVMGMAELLATTDLDPKQKMFTDVIVKSGSSLLTIINDILDFSKIDAGQMQLDPAPFNLAEAIEDVATLVSSRVAEKDLELIVRISPDLPEMMIGDVGRLRQIVTNLLGNAVKFTEKGHVYVNVEGALREGGELRVADLKFYVKDTGIGIPEEKCAQVFQKFSQVDTSATRKHEGTGLGLSIASSLVALMGGEIGVESEFGRGSTFWFAIPLPVHSDATRKKAIPVDLSGSRILIVDDNEVNRAILTEQMTSWQFDSAAAASGPEGIQALNAVLAAGLTVDLVILDYQMPGMSGADVLTEIRSNAQTKETPVLMLTSVDSSEANAKLNEIGVEGNLTKPTRSSMLLETILQIIADNRALKGETHGICYVNMDEETTQNEAPIDQQAEIPQSEHADAPEVTQLQPDASTEEVAPEINEPVTLEQIDILVAEDNEVNQIVVRQILEEAKVSYEIVENGRLAVEFYEKSQPKMILMDVSMPEMNGKEATQTIRQFEAENGLQRTPIVGVTAHALKGDREECLEVGMDDYLSKPVSPNKMLEKIEHWMQSQNEGIKRA